MPTYPSDNPLAPSPVPLTPGVQGIIAIMPVQNPAGTTSTAAVVMMGVGATWKFTPQSTGRALVIVSGQIANNTASDGIAAILVQGTGTAPVNGAALTGASFGPSLQLTNNAGAAALGVPFTLVGVVTGLTLGVPVWLDVAMRALTGGTATLTQILGQVTEF